jgi:hypothetical protein
MGKIISNQDIISELRQDFISAYGEPLELILIGREWIDKYLPTLKLYPGKNIIIVT